MGLIIKIRDQLL